MKQIRVTVFATLGPGKGIEMRPIAWGLYQRIARYFRTKHRKSKPIAHTTEGER